MANLAIVDCCCGGGGVFGEANCFISDASAASTSPAATASSEFLLENSSSVVLFFRILEPLRLKKRFVGAKTVVDILCQALPTGLKTTTRTRITGRATASQSSIRSQTTSQHRHRVRSADRQPKVNKAMRKGCTQPTVYRRCA